MTGPGQEALGIIAGGGSLPGEIARSVTNRGGSVYIVIIDRAADPALKAYPHTNMNWAQLGGAIQAFDKAGIRKIVMVGSFARPRFATARPDMGFLRALPSVLRTLRAGGDDAVLRGVIKLFERRRFEVLGVGDVAPELLAGEGVLSRTGPAGHDEFDTGLGFALIGAMGRHDIGQAAVVTNGVVEAIEGAEGTDRMLTRVAGLRQAMGFAGRAGVLVKSPKPGQDMRVDLPAIGPSTVRNADTARLNGIAVMAGNVLAADRVALLEEADRARLFVAGVTMPAPQTAHTAHTASGQTMAAEPVILGAVRPSPKALEDVMRGADIMSELAAFRTGSAAVLRDRRVLAVGAQELPREVVARAVKLYRRGRRRRGLLIVGPREPLDDALVKAVATARLEGVLVMFGQVDRPRHSGPVIELADRLGLFVAAAAVVERDGFHG